MKRKFAALFAALMLFGALALAEGPMTEKPITFSGMEYGVKFGDVRSAEQLREIRFKYAPITSRFLADVNPDMASEIKENKTVPTCFFASPREFRKVAGHDASVRLWFVYPQEGAEEDDAQFYAGEYEFYNNNGSVRPIYDDLRKKLDTLYGEPYYEGKVISEALGEPPFNARTLKSYYQIEEHDNPRYKVWRSSANNAMLVLKYYEEGGERTLTLTYIDETADALFN